MRKPGGWPGFFFLSDLRLAGCVKEMAVEKWLEGAVLLGVGECRIPQGLKPPLPLPYREPSLKAWLT
jgi:hypothetical protein